jgi:ABC-2 type transport system permease protein
MRRFGVLLRKEIRELATLQALAPFLVVVAVFALMGNLLSAQGADARAERSIAVIDRDASEASRMVAESARAVGLRVVVPDSQDPAIALSDPKGPGALVVVPEGFGDSIAQGRAAPLDTYVVFRDFTVTGSRDSAAVAGMLSALAEGLQQRVLAAAAPTIDPAVVMRPLALTEHVIVGGRRAVASPDVVMGIVMAQTTFVPIVLFVVIVFAAQMVAAALASEKENKTLETLLAMPVPRSAIAIAKMVAAGLLALLSAGVYMTGLRYLQRGIEAGFVGAGATDAREQAGRIAAELGLVLSPADYALLGLSLFFAILVALAIALVLGAFAENVKAVQPLLTPLIVAILVPYFLTLFADIGALPPVARAAVWAVPFTHPFLATPSLFVDDVGPVILGIAYQAVWFVALVAVATRLFRSDRLLTVRLNLSRRHRRSAERSSR